MKLNYSILTFFLLASCASELPSLETTFAPSGIQSDIVTVHDHFPPDRATDIPVNSKIIVQFTRAIQASSVDHFTFQVRDEIGKPIEGNIQISPSNTEIIFTPTIEGRDSAFDLSTKIKWAVNFVLDENSDPVGNYYGSFTTKKFGTTSGKFKVMKLEPKQPVMFNSTPFIIHFSEPLLPNRAVCDLSDWNESIQVFSAGSPDGSNETRLGGGQVRLCLECEGTYCNRLAIYPRNSGWGSGSFIHIRIKGSPRFRGLSGENLSKEENETKYVIF